MEFPDFNNQEDHDQIQVENVDNVFGYNNEQYQPHVNNENSYPVVSDPAGAGWNSALVDTHSRINDLTMTIDDEEEKRIAARRQEEEERRSRIVQLMNDEMRIKQEWRNKAQEFMENVER